jgi:hypothetical protein
MEPLTTPPSTFFHTTNMDRKKAFELILNDKIKAFSSKNTKATKNKLKLFHEEIHGGDVFLVFLKNAQGYYAGAEAYAGPIHEIIKQWTPPYKSQLFNASGLSFNSLSETNKAFGDVIGGTIDLPDEPNFEMTAHKMLERLEQLFMKPVVNYLSGSPDCINDVVRNPERYAYPLATLIATKVINPAIPSDVIHEIAKSKKAFSAKTEFDKSLLLKI